MYARLGAGAQPSLGYLSGISFDGFDQHYIDFNKQFRKTTSRPAEAAANIKFQQAREEFRAVVLPVAAELPNMAAQAIAEGFMKLASIERITLDGIQAPAQQFVAELESYLQAFRNIVRV